MNEEEIEWFEENWNRGKSKADAAETSREYKKAGPLWEDWGERPHRYWKDSRCWKSKRKTHYKIPKVKKDKKRKPSEKEHWRYKENYSWSLYNPNYWKVWNAVHEGRKKERVRQYHHIQELKLTGKWVSKWKYEESYNGNTRTYQYFKQDLNDPFDHGSYYEHHDRHGKYHEKKGSEWD